MYVLQQKLAGSFKTQIFLNGHREPFADCADIHHPHKVVIVKLKTFITLYCTLGVSRIREAVVSRPMESWGIPCNIRIRAQEG